VEYGFVEQACRLMGEGWHLSGIQVQSMTPDGSLRRFCRLRRADGLSIIAVAPPEGDAAGLAESLSGWHIGHHLWNSRAPVPRLFAFDRPSGLLVCEDLGDVRLHDLVTELGSSHARVERLYEQAVAALARMQVIAREKFDTSWCWDSPHYDRQVMLERESGYFLRALCQDLLQLSFDRQAVEQDFSVLAKLAVRADAGFFLHRDFQSRNIMVRHGKVFFIDYQAGRLGPAGYDLASLLIDPYADLPRPMQDNLLECYLDELTTHVPYERQQFTEEYMLLALQRNLQILGAFAFLSHQRGKPFFRKYLKPSLHALQQRLECISCRDFHPLKELTQQCLAEI
jgi:aminoglycoside/choline kinase family phosphotransferase